MHPRQRINSLGRKGGMERESRGNAASEGSTPGGAAPPRPLLPPTLTSTRFDVPKSLLRSIYNTISSTPSHLKLLRGCNLLLVPFHQIPVSGQ